MRTFVRSQLPATLFAVAALAAGCVKEAIEPESVPVAASPEPPAITVEEMERPSPSAALVEAFVAVCGEPARGAVARAARRRDFVPVPIAVLREEMAGAAFSEEAEAWRAPVEVAGAVLLWDAATSTCEIRVQGIDPMIVEAEFAKLPQTFEEAGSSVIRLPPPPPARAGAPRTRQMLLVSPGGSSRPERARVLRLGDATGRDAVALSARSVAATR